MAIAQHVKQAPVHPFVCTPLHSHCFVHGEKWCIGGGGGNPLSTRWGVEAEGKQGEANPGQPQVKGVTQTPAAWLDNLTLGHRKLELFGLKIWSWVLGIV